MKPKNHSNLPLVEVSEELLGGIVCEIPEGYEEDRRELYLNGEIISSTAENVTNDVYFSAGGIADQIRLYNRDDEGIPVHKRKPIKIFINSPGGDLYEGMPLVEMIRLSKTPVYTINVGRCASMAFLIFIVGHKRLSLKNMTFLCHDSFISFNSTGTKARDIVNFYNQVNDAIEDIIISSGNMEREEFRRRRHEEIYMFPEEAKKYGFVDEIVADIEHII